MYLILSTGGYLHETDNCVADSLPPFGYDINCM